MGAKHRTATEEMKAWVCRIEDLRLKEERCPSCAKVRKEAKFGELICRTHKQIRVEMTFGSHGSDRFKTVSRWRTFK